MNEPRAIAIAFLLDGEPVRLEVPGLASALDVLRQACGPTGPREGCREGECGACAILIDDVEACACLIPAHRLDGVAVVTAAGLARDPRGARLLREMSDPAAAPCGFCAPGFAVCAWGLRLRRPRMSGDEAPVRAALAGHLCRCSDYSGLVDAARALLAEDREESGR